MIQFLILLLVLALVVFPLWAIIKIIGLGRQNDALAEKLAEFESALSQLDRKVASNKPIEPPVAKPASTAPAVMAAATPAPAAAIRPSEVLRESPPPVSPVTRPAITPPPLAPIAAPTARAPLSASTDAITPPPLRVASAAPKKSLTDKINWEHFMGAKLFAWLGGLAAFLSATFLVKYSVEHNWIPPEVRVAIGFLFAVALIVGGLKIPRERYAVTSQTLIATGIVTLYAVTFACNSIYHFAFFGAGPTFAVMSLITATAFLLAVRLEAKVVAVLGILGGFLTPILLSTGHDNPPGLFGYIALLDVGLIAVALHRRWNFLFALGAAGTAFMELGWAMKFLEPTKAGTAMIVTLGFSVLFLAAYEFARRHKRGAIELTWSAIALPLVALGFAVAFLDYPTVAARPGMLFTFVLLADACLLALAWLDDELPKLHLVAGMLVFGLLAGWTATALTPPLLPWALAVYLLHAALHTAFPLVLERHRPAAAPTWWSQLFPPLALVLMLGPLFKLDAVSLLFWPCVLLVDLLAIGLALFTASLAAVAIVLLLTLGVTGVWIFQVPATVASEPGLLLIVGGFAVLFFAATIFLGRRLAGRLTGMEQNLTGIFGDARAQLPAFSALLPFLLLIMMTQRLPLANPSPVFGLALLLVVLTLGLAVILGIEWLPACALAGVAGLEYAWSAAHVSPTSASAPLTWYLMFYAVFAAFPFVFRRRFIALIGPWVVAAVAGVAQFPLVYRLVQHAWPNDFLGLLPAAFSAAPLLSLVLVLRAPAANDRTRLNQLAWFGGVGLLFITLIFPIQFERQWLTVAWALEGAALLWLFHRVPHPGLRGTGLGLLVVAFARLALNPAVLEYHVRGATALLNWYLYSYGLVTAALFVGARLVAPPRERVLGLNAPALLNTLGTVLAFLLLNLEIADFFSRPGTAALVFQFSGNFARDMTYTIAWALFALGLLLVSIWKRQRAGRYAALALLGITLLKLFLHDLARLDSLYRVGALFAVAVVAIAASVAYQRFLPSDDKTPPPSP
jgi:hypothetical protein